MMSYVITLVHGTWAQDAQWMREESALCASLRNSLSAGVAFRAFRWSGRNSHLERRRAAERLRAELITAVAEYPDANHYVIAHSHGGNVAFHALKDRDCGPRISGVVFLSTPFLFVR